MKTCLIGVDLGTMSTKAAIFDADGHLLASAYEESKLYYPQPATYSHGPKILWWMQERPEVFREIHKFVVPGGYVAGRMAGLKGDDAFIDYTYIHFSCLSDALEATWDEDLCREIGIPMEKLPRIVSPWEVIGKLTSAAAEDCGLKAGTPIAAGAGDQAAGMLGAAMVEPGLVFDVAGTASVFAICVDRFVPDVAHKTLFTARLVPEDLWYALAYVNGGGLNLRWFRDELAIEIKEEAKARGENEYLLLDRLAAEVGPGADGLLFLPHLQGRVCPSDADVRGLWMGFTWAHRKPHFYRAMLEAVAYEYAYYLGIEKALVPGAEFRETRVIGGGARSQLWNQIKSDVLGEGRGVVRFRGGIGDESCTPWKHRCRGERVLPGHDAFRQSHRRGDIVPDSGSVRRSRRLVSGYRQQLCYVGARLCGRRKRNLVGRMDARAQEPRSDVHRHQGGVRLFWCGTGTAGTPDRDRVRKESQAPGH